MSKLFLLLVLHCLITINYHHYGSVVVGKVIRKEEYYGSGGDIDEQLKILNKPPIKTFETKEGVNVDCIDINKQPAFHHPLLKDHVLQLKPGSLPTDPTSKSSLSSSTYQQPLKNAYLRTYACPEGTVPIRRTSKQDLIRAKQFTESFHSSNFQPSDGTYVHHVAYRHSFNVTNNATRPLVIHGLRAEIKLDNPAVQEDQISASVLLAEGGPKDIFSSILAGWMVAPPLYGDNHTHLSIFWRNGTTNSCFDIQCPGFVQVSSSIPIGQAFPLTSEYGTNGYSFVGYIFQDANSLNWWFKIIVNGVSTDIGYWPREIIPYLTNTANYAAWGGLVMSPLNTPSPPMGNGHFPEGDIYKVSAMLNIQYVDETYTIQTPRNDMDWENLADNEDCYKIDFVEDHLDIGRIIFFGGPGGNC